MRMGRRHGKGKSEDLPVSKQRIACFREKRHDGKGSYPASFYLPVCVHAPKTMLHGLLAILSLNASPHRDSQPQLDTAFVVSRRLTFGGVGRFQRSWQGNLNNTQSVTGFLAEQGVFLKQYGVSGIATISRRGADPQQTQVLWNGLPVANAMLGMPDLNTMYLFGNTEISLIDGGNASAYGSGSVGGTLQLTMGKPLDTGFSASNAATVGNYGRLSNGTDIAWKKQHFWTRGQFFMASNRNDFIYRDVVNNEWQNVRMQNAQTHFTTARWLAGVNFKTGEIKTIIESSYANRNLGNIMGSQVFSGNQIDYNKRALIESNIYLKKVNNINRLGITRDQIVFTDTAHHVQDTSLADVKHFQTEWYFNYRKIKILTGADLQWQSGRASSYHGVRERIYPAQFLSVNIPIKNWIFNTSIRFEWYEKIPVWSASTERNIAKRLKLKANAHNTFRRPTLNDLFWGTLAARNLKNEYGYGAETGIEYGIKRNHYFASFTSCIYARNITNAIVWMPANPQWIPMNAMQGKFQGLQFMANQKWVSGKSILRILLNYDYLNSAMLYSEADVVKRERIFVPRHSGNLLLGLDRGTWNGNVNYVYTGARFISTDNSEMLNGFGLLNLQLSHTMVIKNKWTGFIQLSIQNLSNIKYENMPGKPMPGRNFLISLILKYNQK